MLRVAFHPNYVLSVSENHRFPMVKYDQLAMLLMDESLITPCNLFRPEKVDIKILALTHDEGYIQKVLDGNLSKLEEREIGFNYTKELVERELTLVGATIECCHFAIEHGVAMNIAGGTHHAFSDRGEGFCVFNDQAVAANYLIEKKLAKKVLIIDLDVHQGNGTAEIFENNSAVITFSMHGENNYPFLKQKSDFDVPLPDGTTDGYYLNVLKMSLKHLMSEVEPDFVFYQSGVDVLKTDKMGKISLTKAGCKHRDELVFKFAKENQLPLVVCMGGGYSLNINDIVEAHTNTFRVAHELYCTGSLNCDLKLK
tara:strand:+ start:3515 stop:4450 length:936 start_codon:yes stop_codon:yes gene_type:complete